MGKTSSFALKLAGALLSLVMAIPLGSWAAARAPIVAQASWRSGAVKSVHSFCVHRRARRQRRDFAGNHGNWSRALTPSVAISQSLHAFRLEARPFERAIVDLPPPDLPPA